jgi:glutamate formiminotransferase/formiminotetrahydrofolate cyclodeaminase
MVAGLTIGRKKYAAVENQMRHILAEAEHLRATLTAAVEEDAAAFEAVMAAFRLPKDSAEQEALRAVQIQQTTLRAAHIPLLAAKNAVRVIELAVQVVADGNLNAISDGASGAAMARAALTAAGTNVRINVNSLTEKAAGIELLDALKTLEARAAEYEAQIRGLLETRAGFNF